MTNRRRERLRQELRNRGYDALIVTSLTNIRYLTGFSGSNAFVIIRPRNDFFLTDTRYTLQSRQELPGWKRFITTLPLAEAAEKEKLLKGAKRVAFESAHTTYAAYRQLKKLFPGVSFVPTSDIIEGLVLSKEPHEIQSIIDAVKITDRVFNEVLKSIKPGIRESEIAAKISFLQRTYGAEKDAFDSIVASGERGALPHAHPTEKRIRSGEFVTLDFGCTKDGYNSDLTRTIAVGRVTKKMREIYETVREAQQAAVDVAKGDMMASDLDAVARNHIKARGYGKYFTHSLGHGLGLQVHERPRVSALSKEQLQMGSVITIEPGVYVPGFGGVRIEDDVVLTPTGCKVLNKAPKELLVV